MTQAIRGLLFVSNQLPDLFTTTAPTTITNDTTTSSTSPPNVEQGLQVLFLFLTSFPSTPLCRTWMVP